MRTWTDTTYHLAVDAQPCVTTHTDNVSMHHPGFCGDGRGFSVHFTPAHLPLLRELLCELEPLSLRLGERSEQTREESDADR